MEDGVDNGMIIYITLTAQIIAAGFSIEIFNYISLHSNTTVKRCSEIFPDSLLGKNRFCKEKSLKIPENSGPVLGDEVFTADNSGSSQLQPMREDAEHTYFPETRKLVWST